VLAEADLGGEGDVLSLIAGSEPSPDFAAVFAEEFDRRLEMLPDDGIRAIVLDRLAGYKDEEIAARLGCTRRTVMRKLAVIRNAWRVEVQPCVPTP
jgi:DNA-directed RNA polymerase specialized sigma24 family protein